MTDLNTQNPEYLDIRHTERGIQQRKTKKVPPLTSVVFNVVLQLNTCGIELIDSPWLAGGRQPALHHGVPEGELAEARTLGNESGEPAPRLPPLRHGAGPRTRLRGHGGEDVE